MSDFSTQLKMLRQSSGISQQVLADKIGISKSSINMYERGEREPGIETLTRMANFFNVDVDYLFGKSDVKRKSFKIKDRIEKNIGANVRKLREDSKISKKRFADLLGIDEADVDDLENGKTVPDKEMKFRICDILHITPDFLDGTIIELLEDGDIDAEYRCTKKQNAPDKSGLTEGEKMWLELYNRVSDDTRSVLINMVNSFARLSDDENELALRVIRAALGDH